MTDGDDDPDSAGARVRRIRRDLDEGRTLCLHNGATPTAEAMRIADGIALRLASELLAQTGSPVIQRMVNAANNAPAGRPKVYDDSPSLQKLEFVLATNPEMKFHRAATLVARTVFSKEQKQEVDAMVERLRKAFKK